MHENFSEKTKFVFGEMKKVFGQRKMLKIFYNASERVIFTAVNLLKPREKFSIYIYFRLKCRERGQIFCNKNHGMFYVVITLKKFARTNAKVRVRMPLSDFSVLKFRIVDRNFEPMLRKGTSRKRKRTRRTGFIPIPNRNFEKTDQ